MKGEKQREKFLDGSSMRQASAKGYEVDHWPERASSNFTRPGTESPISRRNICTTMIITSPSFSHILFFTCAVEIRSASYFRNI